MPLPIGFFMPLPLPIMIPFMMWQSAAIAAGFGTYFQYAKRRVSAMSNEEFNNADPHQLVESLYEDIVKSIPSSFAKVDSLTPVMLQSMNVMLDQAVKWLQGAITGNIFGTPNPVNEGPLDVIDTTPSLDTGLAIDSSTILGWNDTKFFHELNKVKIGTSTYNQASQNIILSLEAVRNREKILPTEDFVPGPSLSKFGHIIIINELSAWHSLFTKKLNDSPNALAWANIANNMFSTVSKSLFIPGESSASRNRKNDAELIRVQKKNQIVAVIQLQNKTNIPNR